MVRPQHSCNDYNPTTLPKFYDMYRIIDFVGSSYFLLPCKWWADVQQIREAFAWKYSSGHMPTVPRLRKLAHACAKRLTCVCDMSALKVEANPFTFARAKIRIPKTNTDPKPTLTHNGHYVLESNIWSFKCKSTVYSVWVWVVYAYLGLCPCRNYPYAMGSCGRVGSGRASSWTAFPSCIQVMVIGDLGLNCYSILR